MATIECVTKPVHKQNVTGRTTTENLLYQAVNRFTAESKLLLLSAFKKYEQFWLHGLGLRPLTLHFIKRKNGLYFTEYFQIIFTYVLQTRLMFQN